MRTAKFQKYVDKQKQKQRYCLNDVIFKVSAFNDMFYTLSCLE